MSASLVAMLALLVAVAVFGSGCFTGKVGGSGHEGGPYGYQAIRGTEISRELAPENNVVETDRHNGKTGYDETHYKWDVMDPCTWLFGDRQDGPRLVKRYYQPGTGGVTVGRQAVGQYQMQETFVEHTPANQQFIPVRMPSSLVREGRDARGYECYIYRGFREGTVNIPKAKARFDGNQNLMVPVPPGYQVQDRLQPHMNNQYIVPGSAEFETHWNGGRPYTERRH